MWSARPLQRRGQPSLECGGCPYRATCVGLSLSSLRAQGMASHSLSMLTPFLLSENTRGCRISIVEQALEVGTDFSVPAKCPASSVIMIAKIPLLLAPQPEGGYTVTSPLLPELITEGESIADALANAEDAFAAVVEIYKDRGRPLPAGIYVDDTGGPLSIEAVVSLP